MSDELVEDGTDEAGEHLWLVRVRCHHHRQSQTALQGQRPFPPIGAEEREESVPRQEHLAAWNERDVGPPPQDGPEGLESAREDVHRQLAATLLLLDKEGEARGESCVTCSVVATRGEARKRDAPEIQ